MLKLLEGSNIEIISYVNKILPTTPSPQLNLS